MLLNVKLPGRAFCAPCSSPPTSCPRWSPASYGARSCDLTDCSIAIRGALAGGASTVAGLLHATRTGTRSASAEGRSEPGGAPAAGRLGSRPGRLVPRQHAARGGAARRRRLREQPPRRHRRGRRRGRGRRGRPAGGLRPRRARGTRRSTASTCAASRPRACAASPSSSVARRTVVPSRRMSVPACRCTASLVVLVVRPGLPGAGGGPPAPSDAATGRLTALSREARAGQAGGKQQRREQQPLDGDASSGACASWSNRRASLASAKGLRGRPRLVSRPAFASSTTSANISSIASAGVTSTRTRASSSPAFAKSWTTPGGTSTTSPASATTCSRPSRKRMRPWVTVNVSVWIGWTCASGTAPPGRSASSNASRSPPLLAAVSMNVNRSPVTGFSSVRPGWIGWSRGGGHARQDPAALPDGL